MGRRWQNFFVKREYFWPQQTLKTRVWLISGLTNTAVFAKPCSHFHEVAHKSGSLATLQTHTRQLALGGAVDRIWFWCRLCRLLTKISLIYVLGWVIGFLWLSRLSFPILPHPSSGSTASLHTGQPLEEESEGFDSLPLVLIPILWVLLETNENKIKTMNSQAHHKGSANGR